MWRFFVLVHYLVTWSAAQNGRTSGHQDHSGPGWDIRLAVPGEPGSDYPTLGTIPRTSFSCAGKEPGYYADLETNCQAFRVCTIGSTYGFQSFLCPNGTLFNQAVFVCDWWMNVNCQDSERLFKNNNEKFGKLRLGPQLMKDIKKMLTHPMRNPYDRNAMKGNLIVMQDYRPPYGQNMFSNGGLNLNLETPLSNIYIPAKQVQSSGPDGYNYDNDIVFAASTPNPRYLPADFNSFQFTTQNDAEVFQRQRQNTQSNRQQISQIKHHNTNTANTQFGQLMSNKNVQFTQSAPISNNGNIQYGHKQISNSKNNQVTRTQNAINNQRGQLNQQSSFYTANQGPSRVSNGRQAEFSIAFSKQQYNTKQEKQPYTYQQPQPQFSSELNSKSGYEAKQNLVSTNDIPSTVITKTLTLKRIIQDPKRGSPKSRITVKTWVVKPSKSAKLISPTPYTYDKPTEPTSSKLLNTTPYSYNYNKPTIQSAKIIGTSNEPYVYNKPTPRVQNIFMASEGPYVYNKPARQTQKIVSTPSAGPYTYNKPTTLSRQTKTPSKQTNRVLPTITSPQPSLSRLYLTPTVSAPTQSSRLYLPPTTYNPSSRLYLPPSAAPVILSREYLPASRDQSEQLNASPTTPSPLYASPESENNNSKNPIFTDILTKERLDNTVNNIVKDTSKVFNTDQAQFEQFRNINSLDYPDESYLPPKSVTDSGESLTSQPPTPESKSSRLIASPSIHLEPPIESLTGSKNANQFSRLPFYMESLSPTNTIERTVSLKISIPEKIASYLFKNSNDSDLDKLEILNTGSSNYLVLTNSYANRQANTNFIPIGKLISDKSSNISNSQALVFSLLADSINVAKEYNNAQVNTIQSTPSQTQFQSVNNEDITQISNKISDLTSSQFSNQQDRKNAKIIASTQTPHNNPYSETTTSNLQNTLSISEYHTQSIETNNNNANNIVTNSKPIYSGQLYQLPVPDVTQQVLNQETSTNNVKSSNSENSRSSESEVEIVKPNNIPLSPSARLESAPTSEVDHFNSEENFNKFINSNSGISAQIQDKIVGSIPHPLEDNKIVTYKKDESYYVYTKLDNTLENEINSHKNTIKSNNAAIQQSAKLVQENNLPNVVAFQLIPSISYQLEDEREQDNFLNSFQLDGYGQPKSKNYAQPNTAVPTSEVDYTVNHNLSNNQISSQLNDVSKLYSGPSSYSAPQSSVGNLGTRQDYSSRLELENNNKGYAKVVPSIQFTY